MESTSSSLLLPEIFSQFCLERPESIFCWIAQADLDELNVTSKTRLEVLQDAWSAATRFTECGLPSRQAGEAPINVCILARSGYDWLVAFIGALLNRWTPSIISIRNSPDGIVHLICASKSQHILVDDHLFNVAATIQCQLPSLVIINIASDHQKVQSTRQMQCHFEATPSEADDVVYYMHTSGSTDHPKLVPITHRECYKQTNRIHAKSWSERPSISPMPMFHSAGMSMALRTPLAENCIAVIIESKQPVNGELFIRILRRFEGSICLCPPAILEEIASLGQDSIGVLALAHRVIYAGAALSQHVGDHLAASGVPLMSVYGTTETGGVTDLNIASDEPSDWPYMRFLYQDEVVLVPVPESPGLHRLVIRPGCLVEASAVNHSDPVGFSPGDVWKAHPTKAGLWKHMGRIGSVTVLSNGEKTDNGQLESLITSNALVRHAIVFGEGRVQNGVIVLPSAPAWDVEDVLCNIWPTVEHANSIVPQHSRLVKGLVLVADASKRFALTDKSTIRRSETLSMYTVEIEAAYLRLQAGAMSGNLPEADDRDGILSFIRKTVEDILGKPVADSVDLFESGMDSLAAMNCRSSLGPLSRALHNNNNLPQNILYKCPTIIALFHFITASEAPPTSRGTDQLTDHLNSIIREWCPLPRERLSANINFEAPTDQGVTVLLTGSTGTLGSQLLAQLLRSQDIHMVHCLNRRSTKFSMMDRQRSNMDDPNLLEKYSSKVKYWYMELELEGLGLEPLTTEEIRRSVTHIVHCAWDVNFNHIVDHFVKPHVVGLRNIIELSLSSYRPKAPRIIFISTVAAVANYAGPAVDIPEIPFDDTTLPFDQGYAQSKYIGERILVEATESTGTSVTIVRTGQLSGSTTTGVWNSAEHIPIFLQSCLAIGQIPTDIPDCHWTPTDIAATVLMDILLRDTEANSSKLLIRHIDNPHVLPGPTLANWLLDASQGSMSPTSAKIWLSEIQRTPVAGVRAKRLLEFFENWFQFPYQRPLSINRTCVVSDSLPSAHTSSQLIYQYLEAVKSKAQI
ncbi:hypothetical protein BJ138DRAFT_779746 [Hygrophoropsis aurantiaca]|uniref:Uncharacterized protein n=1 Tax=Hygrophoropsis aurantiaca TaxID=72124 RepID=A0ACB7ZW63_9AGAM|nr:hypothetical protein BJ138DRAFT_779746 [Hygrophoropsis aurantiaca]